MNDMIIVLPDRVSWNSVTELSRYWPHWIWAEWKAVSHSFQDLHSQGVCVCVSMISQQSHQYRMEKWGGVCGGRSLLLGSCEGPLYKTRRMSELQSYQAFQTFDRWCMSTDDSRRFSLNIAASRDHSSLERRWAHICVCITQFDTFPFWKCSRLAAGLRPSEKDRESSSEEGDFESICFLKQASFVSSRWGRQHGHVSTPPALYVL